MAKTSKGLVGETIKRKYSEAAVVKLSIGAVLVLQSHRTAAVYGR